MSGIVQRPPVAWYEVRTKRSEAYWAEGDVIERGDGWLTLWADEGAIALSVPLDDIAAIRRVGEGERDEVVNEPHTCRELEKSEAARDKLRRDRDRLRALLANENPTAARDACCVCGLTDVAYRNYRQQPFCEPCADGWPPGGQAVRALHSPVEHGGVTICAECSAWGGGSTDNALVTHPCPTIRALDGEGDRD